MIKRLLSPALLAILLISLLGGTALASLYRAPIAITENASTSYTMLPVLWTQKNVWLANNGFMSSTANDTRVQTLGGLNQPWMVADNKTLTAVPVPADSQTNLYFVTGESAASAMDIIVGYGGYITVSDNADLEYSGNGTSEWIGWVDTANGANKNLISKAGAVTTNITASGEITATVHSSNLTFIRANSDWVSVPDNTAMDMTNGAGTDEPATIIWWGTLTDATASTLFAHLTSGGGQYNWSFESTGVDVLSLTLFGGAGTPYIAQRSTDALTGYEGQLVQLAVTYSGSETTDGIILYVNGLSVAMTSASGGIYTGTLDAASVFSIGANDGGTSNYLSGSMSSLSFYTAVLTPAQILADYNGTHLSTNLEAWYQLNEGTGNPQDSSGNGHNATANLADWAAFPSVTVVAGASAAHTITQGINGHTFSLQADAGVPATINVFSVPDTASNWVMGQNNVFPYLTSYKHYVGGTLVGWYEPITMLSGSNLLDRAGANQNGVITWGANPAGVGVVLGSMTSSGQPSIGGASDTSTGDILPVVGGTDWRPDATVSATLLANPMRPIVTAISDNTTLSEYQVWVWFGIIFVVFITVLVGARVSGHHLITGIAASAAIILMVVWTVFPLLSLLVVVLAIWGGLVSERSPSL